MNKPTQRRQFSLDYKKMVAEDLLTGRETAKTLMARHNITMGHLNLWNRQYKAGDLSIRYAIAFSGKPKKIQDQLKVQTERYS